MSPTPQLAVRLRKDVLQQVDAARGRLGLETRADAARVLIEAGLAANPATPRPSQQRDPADYLAAFEVMVDMLNDLLEDVSEHYPVAAVALAHNAGVGFQRWAEQEAARHGSTVDQALASVSA